MSSFSLDPFIPAAMSEKFAPATRRHQGIPGIEILPSGRLFAVYYTGSLDGEGPGNYVVLSTSSDGGLSWRELQVVAPIKDNERAYDSVLWLDPLGRLWWFWAQCVSTGLWDIFDGRAGVWAAVCDSPDTDSPAWSPPRRLADGIQMCKPTVLTDGTWVFPAAVWALFPKKLSPAMKAIAYSNLLITRDQGKTFDLLKGPNVRKRVFDEHMLIENPDTSWTVYVRTTYGIGCSTSHDRGLHWSRGKDSRLGGANSRVAIRRLNSGRLLLINNDTPQLLPGEQRNNAPRCRLMAWLSDDDGGSWYGRLMLDERDGVSYPDIAEGTDGFIYVAYDHDRHKHGQILLARFTENDVRAGDFVSPGSYSRLLIAAFPGR